MKGEKERKMEVESEVGGCFRPLEIADREERKEKKEEESKKGREGRYKRG